ncbi:efflux RND transporter periplasmic adaptor subunit [Arenibacter sp. F26102]|uniref:efflux RND transporter periplasmic adaptor subunit n=1 Tax=Arenibacter sp. F26102 TaxID=2926416 RepID=UPI001FF57A23|nr:efflux RND transporter periplasmic adaptor subunit [Arenibacter sp. F26102]MCK0144288.1 efflux RND transporter periplasmic adaptor subunit [Arenibacter sp. F26102]
MKKILQIFALGAIMVSCGSDNQQTVDQLISSGDLNALRAKKSELFEKQKVMESELKKLDSVIGSMSGNENLPLVTTVIANPIKFDHYLDLQGDVKTKQNVLIYPEMQGVLQKVYVKEGQKVSKGQILASIDDGGMGSQLEQLKTQAQLAKTTFERQKRLWDQKIGSEIQYLQAKTNYEATENNVNQMKSQLGKSTIRAPFSGIIDDVIKDQGTVVAPGPGSEIFRIVNLSEMYIVVEVPETYLGSIKNGKEAKVYFPVLGDSIMTTIRQTGNFINPGNRSFTVEIPVPNESGTIKPNLSAKVQLNDYSSENAILIPQSIVSENADGEQYAYVAEELNADNEAVVKKMIITTGQTQNGYVEVLSGINKGNHIIKEGARSVKDGQKVKVLN